MGLGDREVARQLSVCPHDMEQPGAIDSALGQFGTLVDELDRLL
jgi:hypothetical protein